MGILSGLFKALGKIRMPRFNLSFGRKKYKRRTYRKYKVKGGGSWKLKKKQGMPNSPKKPGLVRTRSRKR